MKKSCLLIVCAAMLLSIVGCNTIKGLGQDISAVGGWMIKGSDNVKEKGSSE